MSAPFFLGKVIDTIYTSSSDDFTSSLTSLCIMLSGVFLAGGAANAARVYLMQVSGEEAQRKTYKVELWFRSRRSKVVIHVKAVQV